MALPTTEVDFVAYDQRGQQEQCESCEALIRIANVGSVRLVVPAFSLAGPHNTLMRKGR